MEKSTTITTLAPKRPKWLYPTAQQTPRILNLPRRKSTPAKANKPIRKVKLETLFDQERDFSRVEEREREEVEEEKCRFQAEILRAECNLLRMEREIAVKKMERRRDQVEIALKSALQTLISAKRIMFQGENARIMLEEEIIELVEKLEKLQRRSKHKDLEVQNCSNFDKQASLLQFRLEKFKGESQEIYVKEIQEMAVASLSITTNSNISENLTSNRDKSSSNMEILRRKMEGLSSESLLEKMKVEFNFVSFDNSALCCKAIARRVVDQIRAETEQWNQMQEILGQVGDEMEELQASRAFWEDRALSSDHEIQSLNHVVNEWRRKALASEAKAKELEAQVSVLKAEKEKAKKLQETSNEPPNEMEKRVLVCRLKENRQEGSKPKEAKMVNVSSSRGCCASKRTPFGEIGNLSPLLRQNNNINNSNRAVYPLYLLTRAEYKF